MPATRPPTLGGWRSVAQASAGRDAATREQPLRLRTRAETPEVLRRRLGRRAPRTATSHACTQAFRNSYRVRRSSSRSFPEVSLAEGSSLATLSARRAKSFAPSPFFKASTVSAARTSSGIRNSSLGSAMAWAPCARRDVAPAKLSDPPLPMLEPWGAGSTKSGRRPTKLSMPSPKTSSRASSVSRLGRTMTAYLSAVIDRPECRRGAARRRRGGRAGGR